MVFDVFVVDSPSGYNLGEINDIVQSTQQEPECAQIMNMYIIRRRPKIEFCGSYFGYSVVMFDFLLLFVCLFVVVVATAAVAAAAAVVVSSCFNISDTFIHLVENQSLQTLRNIKNLQTQF